MLEYAGYQQIVNAILFSFLKHGISWISPENLISPVSCQYHIHLLFCQRRHKIRRESRNIRERLIIPLAYLANKHGAVFSLENPLVHRQAIFIHQTLRIPQFIISPVRKSHGKRFYLRILQTALIGDNTRINPSAQEGSDWHIRCHVPPNRHSDKVSEFFYQFICLFPLSLGTAYPQLPIGFPYRYLLFPQTIHQTVSWFELEYVLIDSFWFRYV